jgi:nitrogen fixation-related uncharacterized protein
MCPNCILNQAGLNSGLWVAFGVCGVFFVLALVGILFALKNGEFENMEESKFEMLDDSDDGVLAKQARDAVGRLREKESRTYGGT